MLVHMKDVPGTRVMATKKAVIRYSVRPLDRGGQLTIRTTDPDAVRAVHEFLAFQRAEHHAPH
jgi:TusA-related sulfurtransferase